MTKREKFLAIVEKKMLEYNITDYAKRSDEFEKGLMVGLESLEEYIKSNYCLIKKRTDSKKYFPRLQKSKRLRIHRY